MRAAESLSISFFFALLLVSPSVVLAAEELKEVVTTQGSFPLTKCGLPSKRQSPRCLMNWTIRVRFSNCSQEVYANPKVI